MLPKGPQTFKDLEKDHTREQVPSNVPMQVPKVYYHANLTKSQIGHNRVWRGPQGPSKGGTYGLSPQPSLTIFQGWLGKILKQV